LNIYMYVQQNPFPARGRKRQTFLYCIYINAIHRSTEPFPRKGTETLENLVYKWTALKFNRTLSPQGDGNVCVRLSILYHAPRVQQNPFPARGRKHRIWDKTTYCASIKFNRTLSPQGDGNAMNQGAYAKLPNLR